MTKGFEGALTELQKRMMGRGAKLQVARSKKGPGQSRVEIQRQAEAEWRYLVERTRRTLFRSRQLHVCVLQTVLALIVMPDGTLNPHYW